MSISTALGLTAVFMLILSIWYKVGAMTVQKELEDGKGGLGKDYGKILNWFRIKGRITGSVFIVLVLAAIWSAVVL